MRSRIYIKNLPFCLEPDALESAMKEVLESFGEVKSLTFVYEGTGLRPKGLCFAEMSRPEQARSAIRGLSGINVAGYLLELGFAYPALCRAPKASKKRKADRQLA